jgi:hypothetical protein
MVVRGAHANEEAEMIKAFTVELESPVFFDANGTAHPFICCVCDSIARVDVAMQWIAVDSLVKHCSDTKMTKASLKDVYPSGLIAQYTVPHVVSLQAFVLSPASVHNNKKDTIAICELCANHFKCRSTRNRRTPPDEAITLHT